MRIITRKRLREFCENNPELDAEDLLDQWFCTVRGADWKNFADVRATYKAADQVEQFTVFNIGGHRLRLIAVINFVGGIVYIRQVLPHKDYDKGHWKADEFGKKGWQPRSKPAAAENTQGRPRKRQAGRRKKK